MDHLLLLAFSSAFKFLLFPSYHSTDFEVHRNWLAITASVPVTEWYTEATSEWTLDYPPLFAWFEYFLSIFARYADAEMLVVTNLDYKSHATVLFQRISVIFADLLLYYALHRFYSHHFPTKDRTYWILMLLSFLQPGLLLIDHVHFQYNGFLFGVLILCLALFQEGRTLVAGILFAVLLNLKHIFIYMLPGAFFWLLRFHCFNQRSGLFQWKAFVQLGCCVLTVFFISLSPWLLTGHLHELLGRLFPFGRGLCHAYWAANAWALYNIADKAACLTLQHTVRPDVLCGPLNSRGLVGTSGTVVTTTHPTLFNISPAISLSLVALSLLGIVAKIWSSKPEHTRTLVLAFSLSAYCFFMFGWHVHEKAMLMYVIPLSLLNMYSDIAILNWHLTILSTYAIFPLLFEPREALLKWLVLATYAVGSYMALSLITFKDKDEKPRSVLSSLTAGAQWLFSAGIPLLTMFLTFVLPWTRYRRLEFLPLMLISLYCAIATVYYWMRLHSLLGCFPYCLVFVCLLGFIVLLRLGSHVVLGNNTISALPA